MALTPKQVVNELAKTGRRMTERKLTDWRARELLPKLSEKGKGRGKGKVYFWTQPDILDRAAFVADHKGWDTSRVLLVLWCCGFEVPQKTLKEAWLEEIEKVTRLVTKQDMNAEWRLKAQDYFDDLEDAFHQHAIAFKNLKRTENDDMAEFAYETVQMVCAFIFANAIPEDIDIEIDHINQYLPYYKPKIGAYRENGGFPAINVEVALSMRRFINVFEMRDAIREATPTRIAEAEFIWRTICRLPTLVPQARSPELGLTWARSIQASLGRPALSCLMVALRTKGGALFMRVFEAVSAHFDELEAAKEARAGIGPGYLGCLSRERGLDLPPRVVALWDELIEGILEGAFNIQ